jgi:hypothetical protein
MKNTPCSRLASRAAALVLGAALAAAPGPARADSVSLSWTATGDDGTSGRATAYELRFSDLPVVGGDTLGWWIATTTSTAGVLPPPANAGTRETYVMSGLPTGTTYYFVLRVGDEVPNWSGFSNVAPKTTGSGSGTLATPGSFAAAAVSGGVELTWTEPASDAGEGYHLYRSTGSVQDSLLGTILLGTNSWTDTDVTGGTAYTYRIACYQGANEGTRAEVSITVPTDLLAGTTTGIHGYPNPARGKVTFRFTGGTKDGAPGRIKITIYDLAGHLVRRLVDQVLPAGEQTYDWMCNSDAGNAVAPGLYNAILDGPRGRVITRIAVVP